MNCGQFTQIADDGSPCERCHFYPKKGNSVVIGGAVETIPGAIGVYSGGVILQYDDCVVDGVANSHLSAYTRYLVAVFMDGSTMRLNAITNGSHKECTTTGTEIPVGLPEQTVVGMIYTDANGKIPGGAQNQLSLSWFNKCRSPLSADLTGLGTYSTSFVEVDTSKRLEYLTWGVNSTFPEGSDHPNIEALCDLDNTAGGYESIVAIGIDGAQCGFTGPFFCTGQGHHGQAQAVAPGAGGKAEGYHYASFLMRTTPTVVGNPAAMSYVRSGTLYTAPLGL